MNLYLNQKRIFYLVYIAIFCYSIINHYILHSDLFEVRSECDEFFIIKDYLLDCSVTDHYNLFKQNKTPVFPALIIEQVKKIKFSNNYIYGFSKEDYFIINIKENKNLLFKDKTTFEKNLKLYNLNSKELLSCDKFIKKYYNKSPLIYHSIYLFALFLSLLLIYFITSLKLFQKGNKYIIFIFGIFGFILFVKKIHLLCLDILEWYESNFTDFPSYEYWPSNFITYLLNFTFLNTTLIWWLGIFIIIALNKIKVSTILQYAIPFYKRLIFAFFSIYIIYNLLNFLSKEFLLFYDCNIYLIINDDYGLRNIILFSLLITIFLIVINKINEKIVEKQ